MKKAISVLQKIQISVAATFLFVFMVAVLLQILARYTGIVAMWTQEVASYAFIWALFMGSGAMVYEKRHFAFTSFSDMVKNKKIKKILSIIVATIMLGFSVLMVYYGMELTINFWDFKWVSVPSFNRGPTWLCLPLCGLTSSIYLLNQIYDDVKALVKGGKN